MGKSFFEIFNKYNPPQNIKSLFEHAGEIKLRCAREERIIEADVEFCWIIPKHTLYEVERGIIEAYALRHMRILPKYPPELLTSDYIPQVLIETERTGIVARGFFSNYNYSFTGDELIIEISTPQGGISLMYDFRTPGCIEKIIKSEFSRSVSVTIRSSGESQSTRSLIDEQLDKIDRELIAAERLYEERRRYDGDGDDNNERTEPEANPSLPRVTTLYDVKEIKPEDGIYDSGCKKFDITQPEFIFGDEFDIKPTRMADITGPASSVVIVGEVFDELCEPARGKEGCYNITFSLTDYNSSVDVRCYGVTSDEADKINSFVREGAVLALFGNVKREMKKDKRSQELNFVMHHAAKVKRIDRSDDSAQKRVELHLHTNMSAMDALITPKELISTLKRWGHTAVAVTDHANLQAYPEMMLASKGSGIKVIYGLEAYFVNDTASPLSGSSEKYPSFEDEMVVFDIETTGLSPKNCKITEIGAVKIQNGKIIDKFNTFVDPEGHIPEEITRLTGITDEMVSGAPTQTEAVQAFLDFTGDRLLIAHNASFDMSFIRTACERAGIEFKNPSLDTVALSRYINPDLKNHKLDTLANYFKLGEFNHHRACDDAAMLAEIFFCMIKKMRSLDIGGFSELEREMRENSDPQKLRTYHQIILVKNKTGLKNLYRIVSESYLKYFYRHPRIPKTLLQQYREGLIIGSACEAGELFSAILDNRPESEIENIAEFYDYLEIQPLSNNRFLIDGERVKDDEDLKELNRRIYKLGKKLGKPVVATCDAHFLEKEDEICRKILLAGMKFKDYDRDAGLYLRTTEEMLEEFSYLGDDAAYEVVVANTNLIADMVEPILPIPPGSYTPSMEGAEEELTKLCWERARRMYGDDPPPIVKNRLERELNSIIKHGFAVLYMIAQKLVKFSEDNGYLVGSRGSVGSSFVATMAGISEVNPLPPHYWCPNCRHTEFFTDGSVGSGFDLEDKNCPVCGQKLNADGHDIPFETFLGFYGDKSPDIDLNFSGDIQARVHKYTEELFGADNVFRAGTIGTLASKTAYGYVAKYVESKGISLTRAELNRLVNKCVGVKKTTGQHPGGIIVIPREYEVYDFTPVQRPADDPKSETITTHFAFSYLHDTILKLDELGHDIPTKYKYLEDYSGVKVLDVPMNDKAVYELFLSTRSLGVRPEDIDAEVGTFGLPEMGTRFIQQVLIDARPKNFADLMQISGLTHGTNVWLGNAQDLIKNNICTISEVVGTRDEIMIVLVRYGLDNSMAFKIMEFVRKNKKGAPIPEDMVAAMREKGVPEWYIDSLRKIRYMFPKAHAAAYVMSAIRLGWYKVHKPLAFYCAMFTVAPGGFDAEIVMKGKNFVCETIKDILKRGKDASPKEQGMISTLQLVNECYARNIKFLGVDIKKSDSFKFLPENGAIRLPFSSLGGLGETAALNIVRERSVEPFSSVEDLRTRAGLTKNVIEILRRNGVLDGLSETDQLTIF